MRWGGFPTFQLVSGESILAVRVGRYPTWRRSGTAILCRVEVFASARMWRVASVDDRGDIPSAAGLVLVDGVSLFRPEEHVFEAISDGFANQYLARNLAYSTVQRRKHELRAFAAHAQVFPWL